MLKQRFPKKNIFSVLYTYLLYKSLETDIPLFAPKAKDVTMSSVRTTEMIKLILLLFNEDYLLKFQLDTTNYRNIKNVRNFDVNQELSTLFQYHYVLCFAT